MFSDRASVILALPVVLCNNIIESKRDFTVPFMFNYFFTNYRNSRFRDGFLYTNGGKTWRLRF